jgi:hypothetical protein
MPFQPATRPLPVMAILLAVVGTLLTVAGCGTITPLGPGPEPVSLPPARNLGSPIIMQVMRSQFPTPAGACPVGSVALFGSDPNVPRAAGAPVPVHTTRARAHFKSVLGSTATPAPPATPMATPPAPPGLPAGVACFSPAGRPVTITSAAVSSVTTYRNHPGPAWYGFVVAFPAADVPALTALIHQAYASGDALGVTVGGKLWQAPQPQRNFGALRAEQVNLMSRTQAVQLYRLLVPSG